MTGSKKSFRMPTLNEAVDKNLEILLSNKFTRLHQPYVINVLKAILKIIKVEISDVQI